MFNLKYNFGSKYLSNQFAEQITDLKYILMAVDLFHKNVQWCFNLKLLQTF